MKTVHYIIEQLMIYSNFICILEILDECKEFYSSEEILIILEKMKNHEIGCSYTVIVLSFKKFIVCTTNKFFKY